MSFLDIKNPAKRDAVVADYLTTVKNIKQRNLNERTKDLGRQRELVELFEPVIKSTEKSTEAITKEIAPLQEEIRTLKVKQEDEDVAKQEKKTASMLAGLDSVQRFHYLLDKGQLDSYFAIQRTDDGRYIMGDKMIEVDKKSNIYVDEIKYRRSPGLWSLVMMKVPSRDSYTSDDLDVYRDLVKHTNVMEYPANVTTNSRPRSTYKWRIIFDTFSGSGIEFLPGDIKGMKTKLSLLLGEFAAGNTSSTRNEIVCLLDELLRRSKLTRQEYNRINTYLSQCL